MRMPPLQALGAWFLAAVVAAWPATAVLAEAGGRAQQTAQAATGEAPGPERDVERPGRTGLPLPRFVSLRADKVHLRRGPGTRYPIDWVYLRRNLPVEVIDEFDTWRQIRDHEGATGWVHQSMLQGERTFMVKGDRQALRRTPSDDARALALLEPGVLCRLLRCDKDWCAVDVAGFEGWLRRSQGFGVYPQETVP